MCVVSVPHAHGFQTIPHKNSCRAVCAEMFQNLKLWSSGNILVTISFQIKTDEFCPLLTQRWNTQLWKCRSPLSAELHYLCTVKIWPLSTCLILNFSVSLPHWHGSAVSLETVNLHPPIPIYVAAQWIKLIYKLKYLKMSHKGGCC